MQKDRLVFGLTITFGAMTAFVLVMAVAFLEPVLVFVAIPLGLGTYIFWYQSSGQFRKRMREAPRGHRRQASDGGFGAGPRAGFESARGRQARENWQRRQRQQGHRREKRQRADGLSETDMTFAEAYRNLGLEAGADSEAVKRAYRRKVKEVHPDRGGDEAEFKKVKTAYEMLSE